MKSNSGNGLCTWAASYFIFMHWNMNTFILTRPVQVESTLFLTLTVQRWLHWNIILPFWAFCLGCRIPFFVEKICFSFKRKHAWVYRSVFNVELEFEYIFRLVDSGFNWIFEKSCRMEYAFFEMQCFASHWQELAATIASMLSKSLCLRSF